MGRVNQSKACSTEDGTNTNFIESFFSRIQRAYAGVHHRFSTRYFDWYVADLVRKEDAQRMSNGAQTQSMLAQALRRRTSGHLYNQIHLVLAGDIVPGRETRRAWSRLRQSRVVGNIVTSSHGHLHLRLKLENGNGSVRELLADDALGRQPETIAVERDGSLQILDPKRQHRNTWSHSPSVHARTAIRPAPPDHIVVELEEIILNKAAS
ncbi:transposase [Microvirga makkahensis]|uniref:ISXO2-like transposase domain-containing protein n=1 Tax=Microvirga makkahensis TaxID=1128670 RepID=A0A7X3SQZ8_9HYPH|nr:transposase [Microvirga makkahensis]MXQ14076.1 hypothetical protein [Microvirga makkahensis]